MYFKSKFFQHKIFFFTNHIHFENISNTRIRMMCCAKWKPGYHLL